jgi:hypothetical protein
MANIAMLVMEMSVWMASFLPVIEMIVCWAYISGEIEMAA